MKKNITEREYQYIEGLHAMKNDQWNFRWHFDCLDGFQFYVVAPTVEGAFNVLHEERPGMKARVIESINYLDFL